MAKNMENDTFEKVRDVIIKNQKCAIAVGANATIDDMAGALALYLTLREQGKEVSMASPKDPIVEESFLVGIDRIKRGLDTEGGDLTVSFPYKTGEDGESEIQKVSYTLEDGYLNIIVKAGKDGLSFNEKEVRYRRGGTPAPVLFIVGTPRLSDLGNLFNPQILKDTFIINIDNRNENQGFGDAVLVSGESSSVSEQIGRLITFLDFPLDVDIAQNLLSGISFATNNFQKPNTSYTAFEMAALLMKKGALRGDGQRTRGRSVDHSQNAMDEAEVPSWMKGAGRPQSKGTSQFPQRLPQQPNRGFVQSHQVGTSQHPQTFGKQQANMPRQIPGVKQQHPSLQEEKDDEETPSDWLTPKVYKGSTLV